MLRLYHDKIPNVVLPQFTTLNWGGGEEGGGGDEVCSVNVHQLSSLGWIGLKGYVQDYSLNCSIQLKSVTKPVTWSCYANISVFMDRENNQFLKK